MTLLVTGSIGIDTVEAPWGKVCNALGGSSVYFSYAAAFFAPVRFVGVVGDDCPPDFLKPLHDNPNIDMSGLEVRRGAKTFRWHGRYADDVNIRDTIAVELNVLAERSPDIPPAFRDSELAFLANTHPALQLEMLNRLDGPRLAVADTMDLWIDGERAALSQLIGAIDGLVLNDAEARQLTGERNVVAAGSKLIELIQADRPDRRDRAVPGGFIVIKKGEHGSLLLTESDVIALPGMPSRSVVDPTGAGDSFAGAMMGCLAATAPRRGQPGATTFTTADLRRAIAFGTVTASFTLEAFSLDGLVKTTRQAIDGRMECYAAMLRVE